mmetsp:Transcript_31020/g.47421  ORF Transcript_31020/g.47421 Transcript_31020/m.47421 type:complete len:103 (+) Transcript_31020:1406-1714(+)
MNYILIMLADTYVKVNEERIALYYKNLTGFISDVEHLMWDSLKANKKWFPKSIVVATPIVQLEQPRDGLQAPKLFRQLVHSSQSKYNEVKTLIRNSFRAMDT